MKTALTTREAAAYLGCSPELLELWRAKKEGPAFVRIGRRFVRYRVVDLDAFLAQHVVRHADSA